MKNVKSIRTKGILVGLIFLLAMIGAALATSFTNVFAYTGSKGASKAEQLFNETNTYQVEKINATDNDRSTRSLTYNSVKVDKPVMDKAQITVLTHGLSGEASHWSNNFSRTNNRMGEVKFAYDPDSLISKIDEKVGGANIYWAKMKSALPETLSVEEDDFTLINLTKQNGVEEPYSNEKMEYIEECITDISKHIIVVFEGRDIYGTNDSIYYEFNYMLSNIINDVTALNGGVLPKVNLVGHSRGGITNMQYALDHPDLVASLTSVGTPYFGSTTAGFFAPLIGGMTAGLTDILNREIYDEYRKQWNDRYELYQNINVTAIGGYSSSAFLHDVVDNDFAGFLGAVGVTPEVAHWLTGILNATKMSSLIGFFKSESPAKLIGQLYDYKVKAFIPGSYITELVDVLWPEMRCEWRSPFVSWRNDLLINLDSQLGVDAYSLEDPSTEYKGFNRLTRRFELYDGTDFTKLSLPHLPFGHNLETRDKTVINMMLGNIK